MYQELEESRESYHRLREDQEMLTSRHQQEMADLHRRLRELESSDIDSERSMSPLQDDAFMQEDPTINGKGNSFYLSKYALFTLFLNYKLA